MGDRAAWRRGLLVGLGLAIVLAARAPLCAQVVVNNVRSGETLRYPVALLAGTTGAAAEAQVRNLDNARPDGLHPAQGDALGRLEWVEKASLR